MNELLMVGPVLGGVVGAVLALAPSISVALVQSRGRGLPASLSARMTEEWTGELDAIPDRVTKLLFALGIWMTRSRSFAAAEDGLTSMTSQRSFSSLFGGFGGWKTILALPVVVLAAVAYGASFLIPPQYRAEGLIRVVPQKVPPAYVQPAVNTPIRDRLENIRETILSRTRLEKIIADLDLYAEERRAGAIDQDLVEHMRNNVIAVVEHGDTVRVSYTGASPAIVVNVTDRVMSLFIGESLKDRTTQAEGTGNFLETELEDVRRRLIDKGKRLHLAERQGMASEELAAVRIEYDTFVTIYKDLLVRREQAEESANLERLQLGDQFSLLDPAHLPERPISPNRWLMTLIGAVTGLALGVVMLIRGWGRRSDRPQQVVAE